MCLKLLIFAAICTISCTQGAVLLWSKQSFRISPLTVFTEDQLQSLLQDLGNPEMNLYRTSADTLLLPELKELLQNYHKGYTANGEINTENATEIAGLEDLDQLKLTNGNVLSVLVVPNRRFRRQVNQNATSMEPYKIPSGPVVYLGKSKKDNTFGLLYSSQPLVLKSANSSIFLGTTSPDMINVDTTARDSFTRLNVNIPTEDSNKITLRFYFSGGNTSYWTLESVKISDTNGMYLLNLSITNDVSAARDFSYHCSGSTVFSDGTENTQLQIFNLQVQINSVVPRFGDAYDCVYFVSPAILSGLFVTGLLGFVLIIALNYLGGIKTMDKFDNYKTKQLTITVNEAM